MIALVPVLVVFGVCLTSALGWIGRPFPGFLVLENGIVVSIGRAEWVQARNRRVPFARILEADSRPVSGGREVHAYVSAAPIGKLVTYKFRKGREMFDLAVPVRRFGAADFRELFVPYLAVGLLMILVSAAVASVRPDAPEARALFILCLSIGLVLITAPDAYGPYRFIRLAFMATCTVAPAFVQLALSFPQRSGLLQRGPLAYLALYLPFGALCLALISSMPNPSLFLPLLYILYFLIANAALLSLGALIVGLLDGVRPREPVLLALAALLGSCLLTGAILTTYPLLQRPLSPVWFIGPLLLLPVLQGIAFVRFPSPAVPRARGTP